jgi:hypothetical protein
LAFNIWGQLKRYCIPLINLFLGKKNFFANKFISSEKKNVCFFPWTRHWSCLILRLYSRNE